MPPLNCYMIPQLHDVRIAIKSSTGATIAKTQIPIWDLPVMEGCRPDPSGGPTAAAMAPATGAEESEMREGLAARPDALVGVRAASAADLASPMACQPPPPKQGASMGPAGVKASGASFTLKSSLGTLISPRVGGSGSAAGAPRPPSLGACSSATSRAVSPLQGASGVAALLTTAAGMRKARLANGSAGGTSSEPGTPRTMRDTGDEWSSGLTSASASGSSSVHFVGARAAAAAVSVAATAAAPPAGSPPAGSFRIMAHVPQRGAADAGSELAAASKPSSAAAEGEPTSSSNMPAKRTWSGSLSAGGALPTAESAAAVSSDAVGRAPALHGSFTGEGAGSDLSRRLRSILRDAGRMQWAHSLASTAATVEAVTEEESKKSDSEGAPVSAVKRAQNSKALAFWKSSSYEMVCTMVCTMDMVCTMVCNRHELARNCTLYTCLPR